MTPVNIYDDSLLIIFLILLSVALVICVLELSSKQQRPQREKTCLLGFQQSEFQTASLRLNRLAIDLNFSRSKCSYESSKKQTTKLLMRLRRCAGWSAHLLLQITEDRFLQSRSNCYPRTLRKHGKYDNSGIIVIFAGSSKHLRCVCRLTKSYPAGD